MDRIFRWIVKSLFAPVTGTAGAVASTLGFFLAFLPLESLRIPLLLAFSLVFRLNIIALFLGTLMTIFIPNLRHLPILDLSILEDYWLFSTLKSKIQSSQVIASGAFGGLIGLVCYFFFHWFYNLGLKKRERNQEHVFLDPANRRWSIIKRMSAGFTILIVLVSTIFIESLNTKPVFPELQLNESTAESAIEPINTSFTEEELASQIQKTNPSPVIQENADAVKTQKANKQEVYGFYVNWDENSKTSFKTNSDSITTLVPEWLQLTTDLTLKASTEKSIISEAKANDIKILPLVNNYINNKWDGETLHRLFTTQGAEDLFIQNMLDYVKTNDFDGINIDFEEIHPNDTANFTDFMDKVYEAFHQQGLIVTMDVPPNDNSYDYASLATNVDRMIVMLYDQHNSMSKPGPVAATDWVIESLNQIHIPSEKLILGLGNYGYDWEDDSNQPANSMPFEDIMELGNGTNLQIYWNKQAGNPYIRYKRNDKNHTVWFLDAATFYNQMQLGKERGSSGIAVWRLGSEDPSIWKFISKPKEMDNPSDALKTIVSPETVHYTGAGEILKIVSQSENGKRTIQLDAHELIQNETYSKLPKPFVVARYGKSKHKEVVLTFDDGPDPAYTPQILDILNKNHIKGTFFIVGENAVLHPELVKRMHKEGHEIGNHTFTHPDIESITPFQTTLELNANQRLFQGITGHSTTLFRPPYTANAEPKSSGELLPMLQAQKLGYTMVGELIDSEDWQGHSSQEIVNQVLDQLPEGNVILLHDSGGDRSNTVKALPFLIKELKKRGYTFTTVAELIGKSNSQIMPATDQDNPYLVYDKAVFMVMQGWREGLSFLFYSAILIGILRLVILICLSRKQVKRYKETKVDPGFTPFVSVVIAAYNEEKVICKTIDSILSSDYPAFEILIIDDGSKDDTAIVVQETYENQPLIRLIKKPNGGKSSAVNLGFKEANGEIVVALDADTLIAENAISLLVSHFKDENVAAVSGNVKVGNKGNLLTNWQHIEYVTGFNLERRAFATLNCITVVPGAIGAWKKTAVEEAGYFQEDTLAEDTDITLTLLRNGKKIEFEEKAYAYTEAPEDINSLAKQRYRWVYGTLQCLWKHRRALFNKKHKTLGFIGLPNMWLFQYFYQTISPIADILFIIALFSPNPEKAAIGFILFYLLDFFTALYAFRLEKESPKPLSSLFLQRILYKQLMTYVVIKSILSAIKGVTVGWNKLKRNGNVAQETSIAKVKESA
ncbi:cellulose synthase/poly-beta-1,6-N-acetylglucosamine synthase-like glycosyltransferase/spore germination protein YaaH/peptidoglycan/xylan/chitin deacetylase (PgdA/CDA1 family) [Bacillus niacini]|uniref:Cellulose synthase/poly-beta-1,6-N-acetylglucosamine synthase-like glycosyltransferase/spore germination protein YaaH/peptidoglycan/xylan/chitin deacetylase (PgdA/CDA1 family) n=1 Tax=Neobacillus niacini TaxID=86668 RepID=A0A852TI46_9BACI|nr:polysaccharide deacetylase family protein [Neobacillus niacini]NYE08432.1 cellulose synthase/poly-beta-1,6-N-acetylglucosamine synthase-like glycosyltransferase/spore germination protein YaaH/peptidoglycan/xylan/chitin deacetylase (PgdA/CDA1 family) [Neobacillus niacini]